MIPASPKYFQKSRNTTVGKVSAAGLSEASNVPRGLVQGWLRVIDATLAEGRKLSGG